MFERNFFLLNPSQKVSTAECMQTSDDVDGSENFAAQKSFSFGNMQGTGERVKNTNDNIQSTSSSSES